MMSGGALAIGKCVSTFYLSKFFTSSGINLCPGSRIALPTALCHSRGHTPCVQSVSVTIPVSNPQVRNGCGCATEQARQTSIHWPTSPPWRLRWPPFCTALTPTVLPNSFGVPPDLPFPYLLQVRRLPRCGFCALEMPETLLIPVCLVWGQFLPTVLLISYC